jgi:antitoxin component of RelBE/YafQ-DinJ toxin-antitoxin module
MNITLSVDDQTVEQARRVAQAMNKSLNQVIREYLEQLARRDQAERDIAEFEALSNQHEGKSRAGWKWNREEIYDRKIFSR